MTADSGLLQTDDDQLVEVSGRRMRWWSTLRVVGTLSFIAAVLIGLIAVTPLNPDEAFSWVTVVLGTWVPTPLIVEVVLLATGTVALLAALFIVPYRVERPWWVLRTFVTIVLVVAVPLSVFAVSFNPSSYSVLPESSDGGCRVVVGEDSLLRRGSVGIVQPGAVTVEWLGEYMSGNGYRPFSDGNYSLDWNGKTSDLEILGGINWAAPSGEEPAITCTR